jgi:4,5:9,10-diseco-3-hydroxy-5,9,17-trioxoandrosta-1(10),2-diene-4-oate hydrolase
MIDPTAVPHPLRAEIGVAEPHMLIEADGTQVAVSKHGQGIPVICLHATGHGGRDYADFAKRVAPQGFQLFTIDWPGHGKSPDEATAQPAGAERYARLLADLIPQICGNARPILLGNSIGGAAALSYALRHPARVQAVVLCNPGGLAPPNALAKIIIAGMVKFFAAGERGAAWFPRAFAAYYHLVLPAKPGAQQRARIVAAGPVMAPLLKQAWNSFRQSSADLRARATTLAVPVLFAWAKQDQIVAWRFSKRAVNAIPGAQLEMFEGGHCPFLEDPEAFADAFCAFAKRIAA